MWGFVTSSRSHCIFMLWFDENTNHWLWLGEMSDDGEMYWCKTVAPFPFSHGDKLEVI